MTIKKGTGLIPTISMPDLLNKVRGDVVDDTVYCSTRYGIVEFVFREEKLAAMFYKNSPIFLASNGEIVAQNPICVTEKEYDALKFFLRVAA